ncbi:MAG: hypothetical protein V3R38_04500 [bacterium]
MTWFKEIFACDQIDPLHSIGAYGGTDGLLLAADVRRKSYTQKTDDYE